MTKALIVVDVQNDFCEGGALAVAGGRAVARAITEYVSTDPERYDLIVATQDWHRPATDNGGHFAAEPDYIDTWPAHCMAFTEGAALAPELQLPEHVIIHKGWDEPAYSGFQGTTVSGATRLTTLLRSYGVTEVDVCGLALDYCVKATAEDAITEGFQATVLTDLTAAVHPA